MEISLFKEMIESQDKNIHELDQIRMKYDGPSAVDDHNQHPLGKTRQKRNNIISNQHQKTDILYGPPTNCYDLSRLGYTLNGYCLVQRVTEALNNEVPNLETIYCAFKQKEGSSSNLSTEEKRIGILKLLDEHMKSPESSPEGKFNFLSMLSL